MKLEKKTLSGSVRKYIRKEKARIRREVLNYSEQKKMIDGLYLQFSAKKVKQEMGKAKSVAL
jgi:hypothetical protein